MVKMQVGLICSNFCKDHCDKIELPDPLVVEDLISDKLNNRRKLASIGIYLLKTGSLDNAIRDFSLIG